MAELKVSKFESSLAVSPNGSVNFKDYIIRPLFQGGRRVADNLHREPYSAASLMLLFVDASSNASEDQVKEMKTNIHTAIETLPPCVAIVGVNISGGDKMKSLAQLQQDLDLKGFKIPILVQIVESLDIKDENTKKVLQGCARWLQYKVINKPLPDALKKDLKLLEETNKQTK